MSRDLFGIETEEKPARVIVGPTLDLVLHHETDGAIKVSGDGRESNHVWLPKASIDMERASLNVSATRTDGQLVRLPVIMVTIPESLAREKGLI